MRKEVLEKIGGAGLEEREIDRLYVSQSNSIIDERDGKIQR